MNPRSIAKYLLALACVILFITCKKQSGPPRTELLTLAPWKLVGMITHYDTSNDGRDNPVDVDHFYPCLADDRMTFSTDGSGAYDNGPDTCDYGVPQVLNFQWTFYNSYSGVTDDRVIKFTSFGYEALVIDRIDKQNLVLRDVTSYGYSLLTLIH